MGRIEKLMLGVAAVGFLFKLMHWPLASLLLILALSILSILYFPFAALWFGKPERKDQLLGLSIGSGLAFSVLLVGILFQWQFWPFGVEYTFAGIILCATSLFAATLLRSGRPALSSYFRSLLTRSSGFLAAGIISSIACTMREPLILNEQDNANRAKQTFTTRPDWARTFADSSTTGVFVLWEPDRALLQVSDSIRAVKGFLPASTFKVFNSLVALEEQAVPDERTSLPWDGVHRNLTDWNEDQNMEQAIARSTVWWYQEVARRAGPTRMQHWLDTVGYGNATMGDSIHLFWLQGELRISPVEQVYFLQGLNEERLPFKVEHQRTVKRILPKDDTRAGKLQGKTGWAIRVDEQYGWYVGWVEHEDRTAYFALNMDILGNPDVRKRKTLVHALLEREGWIVP